MKKKIMAIIARKIHDQVHFLALRNNPADPIHGGDFYYVVTGGVEDESDEAAVKREIDEETGISNIIDMKLFPIIKEYRDPWGNDCREKIYGVAIDQEVEHLSVEHIDYKWLNLSKFKETVRWYGPRQELEILLSKIEKLITNTPH